jgi:hypothetical protein
VARIRSVKPELRTSEVVASWPREVRYFFVLLWGYLDDKGRGLDVPKTIAGDCFPHDDDVSPVKIGKWLDLMASSKGVEKLPPICRYEVGGRRYLHCVNWKEHQRPNRPTGSRLPPCPVHDPLTEDLTESGDEALTEDPGYPQPVDNGGAGAPKSGQSPVPRRDLEGGVPRKPGRGTVTTRDLEGGVPEKAGKSRPGSEGNRQVIDSRLSEGLMSGSVPGAGEQGSRGAGEQQQPGSEPLSERLSAAAVIIINSTDATEPEAETLAAWIDRERHPHNLAGLIRALAKGPDLATMLGDQRSRAREPEVAEALAQARLGPVCRHGDPGGESLHPVSGKPLCPLCRQRPGRKPA